MAAASFQLSISLPTTTLFSGSVTNILLPAHDGEVGVLPDHENYLGLLGSGALKYVHDGKDYWLAVSSGIFNVLSGKLSVVAEYAIKGEDIKDIEETPALIKSLEEQLAKSSSFPEDSTPVRVQLQRERAKLEVYRRTHVLN